MRERERERERERLKQCYIMNQLFLGSPDSYLLKVVSKWKFFRKKEKVRKLKRLDAS